MATENIRRTLVVAVTGAILVTTAYYAFTEFTRPSAQADAVQSGSLHRSNAVRRPRGRRRWRRGHQSQRLEHDPTETALVHLGERIQARQPYGVYTNTWFAPLLDRPHPFDLNLLPYNLQPLYDTLLERAPQPLDEWARVRLRAHVYGQFIQEFLKQEYPVGYVIGEDIEVVVQRLKAEGVDDSYVRDLVMAFDMGIFTCGPDWVPHVAPLDRLPLDRLPLDRLPLDRLPLIESAIQADGALDNLDARGAIHALDDLRDNDSDEDSDISFGDHEDDAQGSQNMLDLLYHIAGEQARREGYIHRGVECNGCGVHPIQGIRYHCANCFDYDLCESCEASSMHNKGHVFYKIRIPAPSRGNIKQVAPKWYPGNPESFPTALPRTVSRPLLDETGMDRTEMDALYEQFKCLASHHWKADPSGLKTAIDRKGFDMYFIPSYSDRPSPANLIYDRIFAFYDTNNDGLIGFQEYIRGLAELQDKTRSARLRRIFSGYDLDADGYVDRRDFLRMFRAYYALSKELSREMINAQEDFNYIDEEIRDVVQGSQPISAAFGGHMLSGHESRAGRDKAMGDNGDLHLVNGPIGVLEPDSSLHGDRNRAIGNAAVGDRSRTHPFRSFRDEPREDEPLLHLPGHGADMFSFQDPDEVAEEDLTGPDASLQAHAWPPRAMLPESEDVIEALGQEVPLEEIVDPVDRSRVLYAQAERLNSACDQLEDAKRSRVLAERWRRKQFYLDEEEGMTKPPGYTEADSSDDELGGGGGDGGDGGEQLDKDDDAVQISPRRRSMQSRSSSKVRFDDSAIETDYETRSNTSSRSIPVNERWGGFELSQAEAEIGKDILYQAVQQGFNELLDVLFKDKEDEAVEALDTHHERKKYGKDFEKYLCNVSGEGDDHEDCELMRGAKKGAAARQRGGKKLAPTTQDDDGPEQPTAVADTDAHDPDDHIQLMFGDSTLPGLGSSASPSPTPDRQKQTPRPPSLPPANEPPQHPSSSSPSPYRDPTLPQFRPTTSRSPSPSPSPAHTPATPATPPPVPAKSTTNATKTTNTIHSQLPPPSPATLELWNTHSQREQEAARRGGWGKLSFDEFCAKMVAEDERGKAHDRPDGTWGNSAELGRLQFVGTWLEMASF